MEKINLNDNYNMSEDMKIKINNKLIKNIN